MSDLDAEIAALLSERALIVAELELRDDIRATKLRYHLGKLLIESRDRRARKLTLRLGRQLSSRTLRAGLLFTLACLRRGSSPFYSPEEAVLRPAARSRKRSRLDSSKVVPPNEATFS